MPRERICKACRGWHPLDAWPEACLPERAAPAGFPLPMVIGDSLGIHGVQSQADGRYYDSKSALRRHYRAAGLVEVGNEPVAPRKPAPDPQADRKRRDAIGRAFSRLDIPTA